MDDIIPGVESQSYECSAGTERVKSVVDGSGSWIPWPEFEPRQEHKKKLCVFFESKMLCWLAADCKCKKKKKKRQ